jgi:hypothetical protein
MGQSEIIPVPVAAKDSAAIRIFFRVRSHVFVRQNLRLRLCSVAGNVYVGVRPKCYFICEEIGSKDVSLSGVQ